MTICRQSGFHLSVNGAARLRRGNIQLNCAMAERKKIGAQALHAYLNGAALGWVCSFLAEASAS